MPTTDKKLADKLLFKDVYLIDSQVARGIIGTVNDFPRKMTQQNSQSVRAALVDEVSTSEDKKSQTIVKILVNLGSRFTSESDESIAKEQDFLFRTPTSEVDEGKAVLLELTATFCVDFVALDDVDLSDKEFENFCRSEAIKYLWPFWREHVYNSCAKARVPQLEVPMFNPSDD